MIVQKIILFVEHLKNVHSLFSNNFIYIYILSRTNKEKWKCSKNVTRISMAYADIFGRVGCREFLGRFHLPITGCASIDLDASTKNKCGLVCPQCTIGDTTATLLKRRVELPI